MSSPYSWVESAKGEVWTTPAGSRTPASKFESATWAETTGLRLPDAPVRGLGPRFATKGRISTSVVIREGGDAHIKTKGKWLSGKVLRLARSFQDPAWFSKQLTGYLKAINVSLFEGYQCVSSTQGRISQKSRCLKGTSGAPLIHLLSSLSGDKPRNNHKVLSYLCVYQTLCHKSPGYTV